MIRIQLPFHLQTLARCGKEVVVDVSANAPAPITLRAVIRALETQFPVLQGTVIDHYTDQRRPKVRFFASGTDLSLQSLDQPLPETVCNGTEPLLIIGAISGG
ncbi:MAG: MoaD/ThiS family protein [Pseudohongiellaceae bacterium]